VSEFRKDIEDYFCKFTFGQFVSIILLELVTLFFVFYLGARFGPDLMGARNEVARMQNESGMEAEMAAKDPKKVDYTFREELEDKPKRRSVRVKPSGMSAREYEDKVQEMIAERTTPVIVPAPERRIEKPYKEVSPKPKKETAKAKITNGKKGPQFSIQVGAYRTPREASQAVNRWKGKGYSSYMTIAEIPQKGTWYRVRIGTFSSRQEAKTFMTRFKKTENRDALVVVSRG
jgi:DedD protein